MSNRLDELTKQALALPPADREALAENIYLSLEEADRPQFDEIWIAEAERRYADLKNGKIKGIPGERIFDEIRQDLGWPG